MYERLAFRLKQLDPPRFVAKYDLSKDDLMAQRFPNNGPNLIYYDESGALFYDGMLTEDVLFTYIEHYTTFLSSQVDSEFIENNFSGYLDLYMVYVGPPDAKLFHTFQRASMNNLIRSQYTFFHVFDY